MPIKKLGFPIFTALMLSLILLMAIFPESALQAAVRGLSIWWDVLFPSLFPFFVISEVLLGFGVVHLIGTLLDPWMRPLFRIPGCGGFVAAMGYVSGYPVGAKLTAKLWEQKMITREEGERLVAFTTSSDPIFLIGAVSVGFFHSTELALILAIAHYGSGLLVGLLMRFHGDQSSSSSPAQKHSMKGSRLKRAVLDMHAARSADGRPLGVLLTEAIQSSLQLMVVVGGLVVFFSVFLELWTQAGVLSAINAVLGQLLMAAGAPEQLSMALMGGLFEVTLGAKYAGGAGEAVPLIYKAAVAAFVLSWGGLSVHAQIASILHSTNLRYLPFMGARLLHGAMAFTAVLILWGPFMGEAEPVFTPVPVSDGALSGYTHYMAWFSLLLTLLLGVVIITEAVYWISRKLRKLKS
ncbi:sporulation integral membrane protein YlbJ [Paenibacillus sp. JSM ZJ436]|uniref:sporulation integral membrane protein YlbJ n=1 Tax=Paenibacillus sp. JSM ZJ436 TaxID=3376190 RepID=UPI0037A1244D